MSIEYFYDEIKKYQSLYQENKKKAFQYLVDLAKNQIKRKNVQWVLVDEITQELKRQQAKKQFEKVQRLIEERLENADFNKVINFN